MNALILCVGSLKEKYLSDAVREYMKRLSRYGTFELREVPDLKLTGGRSGADDHAGGLSALERDLVRREGESLLRQIRPADFVVALAIDGHQPSSPELAGLCGQWRMNGPAHRAGYWRLAGSEPRGARARRLQAVVFTADVPAPADARGAAGADISRDDDTRRRAVSQMTRCYRLKVATTRL